MSGPFQRTENRRIAARVVGLYRRLGTSGFVTNGVLDLDLSFEGIVGDVHSGLTRRSSGREPWYPRRTELRNERQLSLLAPDELAAVADALYIEALRPEWIGGNLLVEGIDNLSWLPPRTLLFFEGGVTLKIDGDNRPCRASGRAVAGQFPGRADIEFGFVKAGRHRRGLVAWVEKPGRIVVGERFEARLPEQWIYA